MGDYGWSRSMDFGTSQGGVAVEDGRVLGPSDSTRSAGFLFWLLDARSSSAVKGSPQACPVKSGILAINSAFE